jgi:hypothetical protein
MKDQESRNEATSGRHERQVKKIFPGAFKRYA